MPGVLLACPGCRGTFESTAAAGQQVRCPKCGQMVLIPGAPAPAAPAPAVAAPSWYFGRDNQRYGPYALPQLVKMVDAGQLQRTDLVWKEGMPDWVPAGTIPDLFPTHLGDAPAASAAEPFAVPPPQAAGAGALVAKGPSALAKTGAALKRFGGGLWLHLRRAFTLRLTAVPVSDQEKAVLLARRVGGDTGQKMLVARRSIFLVVAVATGIAVILRALTAFDDVEYLSAFGKLITLVDLLAEVALPATALLAFWFWPRLKFTRSLLVLGWVVAFLVPIGTALFPISWILNTEAVPATGPAVQFGLRLFAGLIYYIALMPTVLAIIPGLLRACVRVKMLLPQSVVTGWFLVAGAPFYSLLVLVIFVSLNQLARDPLLIAGVLLLMAAPLVFLTRPGVFIRPGLGDETRRKIAVLQVGYLVLVGLGVVLLTAYLLTARFPVGVGRGGTPEELTLVGLDENALIGPLDLVQYYVQFFGRALFTSVVGADLLMLMNFSVWYRLKEFRKTDQKAKYDQLMARMGEFLYKN